jgi:hypothetical protein
MYISEHTCLRLHLLLVRYSNEALSRFNISALLSAWYPSTTNFTLLTHLIFTIQMSPQQKRGLSGFGKT